KCSALRDAGARRAEPFDPAEPVGTPAVLAPGRQSAGGVDPLLEHLARAVQILDKGGVGPDVTRGEVQVAVRGDELVPIHGGGGVDGTTNVVGWGTGWSTLDPVLRSLEREPLAPEIGR